MTDISPIAPIAIRRRNVQRPNIPALKLGALLAATCVLLGDAFKMAYAAPYTSRRPQIASDDDLEGRDPTW